MCLLGYRNSSGTFVWRTVTLFRQARPVSPFSLKVRVSVNGLHAGFRLVRTDNALASLCVCVWPCNPQKEGALNRANLTSQAGRKSVPSYQFGPAKVGAISRVAGWEQKIVEMRELISRFFCCPRGMPAGSGKGGKDSAISTGSADRLCCSAAVGKCQMVRKGARGKSDNRWASSSPPLSGG